MALVQVHRWHKWENAYGDMIESRRLATPAAIEQVGGQIIPGTMIEVDEAAIGSEQAGMTLCDYRPERQDNFEQQVSSFSNPYGMSLARPVRCDGQE